MHDPETRALRRAACLLGLVSLARWLWLGGLSGANPASPTILPGLAEASADAGREAAERSRPLAPGETLDPNVATEADLDRLPGVGAALAGRIVASRAEGVVFRRLEDLEVVPGIGPRLLERIGAHVEIGSRPRDGVPSGRGALRAAPATRDPRIDLNGAGLEELETLPGVGPAIAQRILERRRRGRFHSLEDLLEVKGIGPTTLERLRPRAFVGGRP